MSAAHPLPINKTSRSGRWARSTRETAGTLETAGASGTRAGEGFNFDFDMRPVWNDSALYWQYMKSLVLSLLCIGASCASDIESRVKNGYADSNGVKIHYVSLGQGPLIVMIHGFPDFWYTWRYQMEALSDKFQCVAIDQRGYNLSDKPKGVENYDMKFLVGDVAAVIKSLGQDKAIIVGHDWGGAVAWQFALNLPQMTDRLIILNLPHPRGLARELAHNPEQQKNSQYARNFQQPDAASHLTAEQLT